MRHSPYYRAYQVGDDDDGNDDAVEELDDDDLDDGDFDASADEDDEEELLLAGPAAARTPAAWTRRDTAATAIVIAACGAASSGTTLGSWALLRGRTSAQLLDAMLPWAVSKWAISRLFLLMTRQSPLRFGSWRPYLASVAFCGMLTALQIGLSLGALMTCNATLVVAVQGSAPCWQLLMAVVMVCVYAYAWHRAHLSRAAPARFVTAHSSAPHTPLRTLRVAQPSAYAARACVVTQRRHYCRPRRSLVAQGLGRLRLALLLPILMIAAGVALAAVDFTRDSTQWAGFLVLLSATLVAAIRAALLQCVLQARDVPGLLPRREVAQPLQLACALGPWETLSTFLSVAATEALGGSAFRHSELPPTLLPLLAGMSVLVLVELLLQLNILARTSALTMCVTVTVAEAGTVAALTQAAHDRWAAPKVIGLILCTVGVSAYAGASLTSQAPPPASRSAPPPPPPTADQHPAPDSSWRTNHDFSHRHGQGSQGSSWLAERSRMRSNCLR